MCLFYLNIARIMYQIHSFSVELQEVFLLELSIETEDLQELLAIASGLQF